MPRSRFIRYGAQGVALNLTGLALFSFLSLVSLPAALASMISSLVLFPASAWLQARWVHGSRSVHWLRWAILYSGLALASAFTIQIVSYLAPEEIVPIQAVNLLLWALVGYVIGRSLAQDV